MLAVIVVDSPARLRTVRPDAPAELEEAIGLMLEKPPEQRASLHAGGAIVVLAIVAGLL